MSSQYFSPYGSTNNIKVELDWANYATKNDVENITHVDVSSYSTKNNLTALKSEVDKIDADKLKTVPVDLAKLSNAVKNDVVKKTDYNTEVTNIENHIAGVTKNVIDITKLKAVDTSNFVLKTKLASDVTTLENKIDTADKKIPDMQKYAKIADVATDITAIKNDYVTNASLTSQLNDLKSQHIATEVKTIDNKTKKNASDILALENKLQQKKDTINENERGLSFKAFSFIWIKVI